MKDKPMPGIPHTAVAPSSALSINPCDHCQDRNPVVCTDGDFIFTECSKCKATGPRLSMIGIPFDRAAADALMTWGYRKW